MAFLVLCSMIYINSYSLMAVLWSSGGFVYRSTQRLEIARTSYRSRSVLLLLSVSQTLGAGTCLLGNLSQAISSQPVAGNLLFSCFVDLNTLVHLPLVDAGGKRRWVMGGHGCAPFWWWGNGAGFAPQISKYQDEGAGGMLGIQWEGGE